MLIATSMGLPLPLLRFLAREHQREKFGTTVLLFGRQCVYATIEQVRQMLDEESIPASPLPAGFSTQTNVLTWKGTENEANASDEAFFRLLGCGDVKAMDVSDFEGADFVADLNKPVDASLWNRFDLIVDSGTFEHVFDVPQALRNLAQMLKAGGRAVHISPGNNYNNHGFYQISPTLYGDWYHVNHFSDVRLFLAEQDSHRVATAPISVYEIPHRPTEILMSNKRLLTIAVAKKTSGSTWDRVPMQGYYETIHGSGEVRDSHMPTRDGISQRLKRYVPTSLKTAARRIVPGLDPNFRPWRFRFWGRLR